MATEFGPVSYRVQPAAGVLTVEVDAGWRHGPAELHVHLRAPEGVTLHNVTVERPAGRVCP